MDRTVGGDGPAIPRYRAGSTARASRGFRGRRCGGRAAWPHALCGRLRSLDRRAATVQAQPGPPDAGTGVSGAPRTAGGRDRALTEDAPRRRRLRIVPRPGPGALPVVGSSSGRRRFTAPDRDRSSTTAPPSRMHLHRWRPAPEVSGVGSESRGALSRGAEPGSAGVEGGPEKSSHMTSANAMPSESPLGLPGSLRVSLPGRNLKRGGLRL